MATTSTMLLFDTEIPKSVFTNDEIGILERAGCIFNDTPSHGVILTCDEFGIDYIAEEDAGTAIYALKDSTDDGQHLITWRAVARILDRAVQDGALPDCAMKVVDTCSKSLFDAWAAMTMYFEKGQAPRYHDSERPKELGASFSL
jgi:hypothetical protein